MSTIRDDLLTEDTSRFLFSTGPPLQRGEGTPLRSNAVYIIVSIY